MMVGGDKKKIAPPLEAEHNGAIIGASIGAIIQCTNERCFLLGTRVVDRLTDQACTHMRGSRYTNVRSRVPPDQPASSEGISASSWFKYRCYCLCCANICIIRGTHGGVMFKANADYNAVM